MIIELLRSFNCNFIIDLFVAAAVWAAAALLGGGRCE